MIISPLSNPLIPPQSPTNTPPPKLINRLGASLKSLFFCHSRLPKLAKESEQNRLFTAKIHELAEQIPADGDNSRQLLQLFSEIYKHCSGDREPKTMGFDSNLATQAQKSLNIDSPNMEVEKTAANNFLREFDKIKSTFTEQAKSNNPSNLQNVKVKLFKFARVHNSFKACLEVRLANEEGVKALEMANSHNPETAEKGLELLKMKHPLIYKSVLNPDYIYKQSQIHNMILGVRSQISQLESTPKIQSEFRDALANSDPEVFFIVPALGVLKTLGNSLKIKGIYLRHNSSWNKDTELSEKQKERYEELIEAKEKVKMLLSDDSVQISDLSKAITDKQFLNSNPRFVEPRNKLYDIAVKMSQEFSQDFENILEETQK